MISECWMKDGEINIRRMRILIFIILDSIAI